MPHAISERIVPILAGIWLLLALASAAFFFLYNNAALKRRLWRPYVVMAGMILVGFPWMMGMPNEGLYFLIPLAIVLIVLHLRSVRFCSSCGKTVMNSIPWSKPELCSKCGAKLTK